jgi:hypothetical protein
MSSTVAVSIGPVMVRKTTLCETWSRAKGRKEARYWDFCRTLGTVLQLQFRRSIVLRPWVVAPDRLRSRRCFVGPGPLPLLGRRPPRGALLSPSLIIATGSSETAADGSTGLSSGTIWIVAMTE